MNIEEALEYENHLIDAGKALRCCCRKMSRHPEFCETAKTLADAVIDVEEATMAVRTFIADNTEVRRHRQGHATEMNMDTETERLRAALKAIADHHEAERAASREAVMTDAEQARYHEERRNFALYHLHLGAHSQVQEKAT